MAKYKYSKCDYVSEASEWNKSTDKRYEKTNGYTDIDKEDLEDYIYVCPSCHKDINGTDVLLISEYEINTLVDKKYLLLCNRHNSSYGDNYCLWWGNREQQGGYTSDVRLAHRFTEKEIKEYEEKYQDIAVPVELLKVSEDYESTETFNENLICLVEKGTINKLMGLQLKG